VDVVRPQAPAAAPRDVVFLYAYVSWDATVRRGAHFAQDRFSRLLLEHADLERVLLVDAYRSALARGVRRMGGERTAPLPDVSGRFRYSPLRVRRRDPTGIAAIEQTYRRLSHRVGRVARRHGLRAPLVITTHPLVAGFAPLEWAGAVTFYATDDWRAHPGWGAYRPAYEESFRRVARSGRKLVAVSRPIVERLAPRGPSLVIPNGIDPREWGSIDPPPEWFGALARPGLLYLGTLDQRLDLEMLTALARARPDASIVLVGDLVDQQRFTELRLLPNVIIHPAVDRRGVRALAAAADVGLVPHVRNALTEAMSPLKLYEYLAAGRPVVATDLPPMRGVHDAVTLVDGPESFVRGVENALARGPLDEGERLAFIDQNAWRTRHERLLAFARADP
jgi:glycosyltransferase involved in cell wall biosynthesis